MLENIKCTKSYLGKSEMTSGNAYRVTLTYNGNSIWFIFNDNYLNKSNKRDFVYSLLTDAQAYKYAENVNDFADEFGYDFYDRADYSKVNKIYQACKKQYDRVCKLFTSTEAEILERELEALGY